MKRFVRYDPNDANTRVANIENGEVKREQFTDESLIAGGPPGK